MDSDPITESSASQESFPDRINLQESFDPTSLQRDVQDLIDNLNQKEYIYYSVVPLLGSLLESCPYIQEMVQTFESEVKSVRLLRLEAGAVVKEHTDPLLNAADRELVRLTIPVFAGDDVTFMLNDTPVPMKPGEVWYLRLSDRHTVLNNGPQERINLTVDLVFNDWVEKKLLSAAARAQSQ